MSKYVSVLVNRTRLSLCFKSVFVQKMVPHRCQSRRFRLQHQGVTYCTSVASQPISDPIPDAIPEPHTSEVDRIYPEKIHNLVAEISKLTLLEVADLNDLLKKTLKIKDAPMMAMGAMPGAAPGDEEDAIPKKEKTSFTVKLMQFNADKKVQLIKQIKALIEGMNLVQAKKFVESAPQVVHSDIGKDEAEKLKAMLEEAGGVVEIE